jgi:hypothetical protein
MILEIKKAHRRVAVFDPELRPKGDRRGFYFFFLSAEKTERKKNISAEKEQINITDL